jgi:hypothetical protein
MADTAVPNPRQLAERVAVTAHGLGIETALIGAAALAAHGYVRATDDIDLATFVDVSTKLRELADALRATGLKVELRMPDESDPLGGVLRVWEHEDEDGDAIGAVDVVNFRNPYRDNAALAAEAIRDAEAVVPGSPLRYVRLPHLVALKLYGGSRRDLADVVELLVRNPDADLEAIRALAKRHGGHEIVEQLIVEMAAAR